MKRQKYLKTKNLSKIKMSQKTKKELGAFYTPPKTVEYMVRKLGKISSGAKILEPCGGDGIFVKELIKQGVKPSQITVWDINPNVKDFIEILGVKFECCDTLLTKNINPFFNDKFDFVITNPPYLNKQSKYIKENKLKLGKKFREIGCNDTYSMFMYLGVNFLKENGRLCFITSDTFLTLGTHTKLRDFILKNTKIKEILLAPEDLFNNDGASVKTCIINLEKCNNRYESEKNVIKAIPRVKNESEYYSPEKLNLIKQKNYSLLESKQFYIDVPYEMIKLVADLPKITKTIDGNIGMHTHNNRKFLGAIEGTKLAERYKKQGKNIARREDIEKGLWHIYIKKGGLNGYWAEIDEVVRWDEDSRKNYDIPSYNYFLKEGLIISGISSKFSARYMPKGCLWESNKAMGFVVKDNNISLYYLIGLLNSKLYNYFMKSIINTTSSIQFKDIKQLPFKFPDKKKMIEVESIVTEIISKKKENPNYDYTKEQEKIDNIIFDIYGIDNRFKGFISKHY